ncbi:MAG: lysophospholipid acyltransferase family protein [Alphaproteobacteria bacterium]
MMLLPAFCPPQRQMHVLISLHRDGKLISQVIGHFGQKTVSGSTSRGGKEAVTGILKLLQAGDNISITPDGPRGPACVAAKGVSAIAKFSGRPVLPVTFHSSRHKRMRSWDQFMLALPFGRIRFLIGKPIHITEDADEELARTTIERAMNELLKQADHA